MVVGFPLGSRVKKGPEEDRGAGKGRLGAARPAVPADLAPGRTWWAVAQGLGAWSPQGGFQARDEEWEAREGFRQTRDTVSVVVQSPRAP